MRFKVNVMCLGLYAVSILGLMSCGYEQNKNSNSSVWELNSPRFETTSDKDGGPISLSSFDDAAKSTAALTLKTTDRLVFTKVEDGVTLRTKTVCTPTSGGTSTFEKIAVIPLLGKISVFEFLPLQLLYQADGQMPESACRLWITAVNKSGSTHNFGDAVTFQVSPDDKKLLLHLEKDDGEMRLAHGYGFSGFSLRDANRVPLPRISKGQHYWLKCETFNLRAGQPGTLGQLLALKIVDKSGGVDNHNELCRLFIESGRVIKNMSDFFMLENSNVENLVNNVEMSVAYPKFNGTRQSFKLATVTFFNQMNKVYYGRQSTRSVSASVTYIERGRTIRKDIVLPVVWTSKSNLLILEPGQSARVSLAIPLDKVCRPGTFTVQIYKQLPLPMLELMTEDPRLQGNAKPELSIPMIEPSPLPSVFSVGFVSAGGGFGNGRMIRDACHTYHIQ